jgi:hypothetical protein
MNNWIEYAKEKPAIMQMVHTAHAGNTGYDWVDTEMLRDAASGVKPVTWWMAFPSFPHWPEFVGTKAKATQIGEQLELGI